MVHFLEVKEAEEKVKEVAEQQSVRLLTVEAVVDGPRV